MLLLGVITFHRLIITTILISLSEKMSIWCHSLLRLPKCRSHRLSSVIDWLSEASRLCIVSFKDVVAWRVLFKSYTCIIKVLIILLLLLPILLRVTTWWLVLICKWVVINVWLCFWHCILSVYTWLYFVWRCCCLYRCSIFCWNINLTHRWLEIEM